MERHFICALYFKNSSVEIERLINFGLDLLGFLPISMTLYFNFDEMHENLSYDKDQLLYLIKKDPILVKISSARNDSNFAWFRVKKEGDITSILWSNHSVEFLEESSLFESFLKSRAFVCGYLYDQDDCAIQSITDIEYFKFKCPNQPFKTIRKNVWDEVIDISENWGRSEIIYGIEFLAAPVMWFGNEFFKIIPMERLLQFPGSRLQKVADSELIRIDLFDINEYPSLPLNRNKQKEFWKFFSLSEVIQKYSIEHEIDSSKSLNDFLKKMKKKK